MLTKNLMLTENLMLTGKRHVGQLSGLLENGNPDAVRKPNVDRKPNADRKPDADREPDADRQKARWLAVWATREQAVFCCYGRGHRYANNGSRWMSARKPSKNVLHSVRVEVP